MQHERPINPLPWVVWLLALPMIAMEMVFLLGQSGLTSDPNAIGWRLQALQRFAYSPPLFRAMLELGQWPPLQIIRIVTYPFVQGSFTQALFGVVILLALGKMVAEAFRPWAVLVIFFASAVVGALVFTVLPPGNAYPLFGAYPPVYGLIGGFTFLLWVRLAGSGAQYRAFSLIALLMGVQLLFAAMFGGGFEWVADLTGFTTGFLLSFVVSPGGMGRVMERIRQR